MALQNSGQISLNDLHVEAGGTSGTEASMNDSDIRGLLNASANSQMTFSSFYGASSGWSATMTVGEPANSFWGQFGYNPSFPFGSYGSMTDTTIDTYSNAQILNFYYSGNTHINIKFSGTQPNSGFSSLQIASLVLPRTSASYTVSGNNTFFTWSGYSNPFGSSGSTRLITWNS